MGNTFKLGKLVNGFTVLDNGNVGIGVSNPSYKLSVINEMIVGAQGGSDFLYLSGGSGYGAKVRTYYATGSLNNEISGNGNTLFNLVTGNVGIGVSTPSVKLDIAGDIVRLTNSTSTDLSYFQAGENQASGQFLRMHYLNSGYTTGGTNIASSGLIVAGSGATGGLVLRTDANAPIVFATNGSASEKMRLTSNGNLLVGSSTSKWSGIKGVEINAAETILGMVNGTTALGYIYHSGAHMYISNELVGSNDMIFNVNAGARMRITNAGNVYIGTSTGDGYRLQITGTTQAQATFSMTYAGVAAGAQWINSSGAFVIGLDGASGATERFRISSSGNVYIGTTAGTDKLTVNGSIRAEGGSGLLVFSGGGTGPVYIDYPGVVAGRMNLDNNGALTIRGSLTQNASDRRLKNNIQNISNALNKISQLNGITFTWDTNIYDVGRINDIGVIAQEVQEILPDAVALAPFDTDHVNGGSLSGENYLTVYYEKLIPLLIEGIKELKAEIEILKNK